MGKNILPRLNSAAYGLFKLCAGSAFHDEISERVLDPVKLGRKWDPKGDYVRRYCPELKNMPLRYLFAPWTAPQSVQDVAKCRIGTDYPSPIIDHKQARAHNLELIRQINQEEVATA